MDAENNYLLDASGAKIKNETFTFTMSDKPVELSAVYSIPAIAMSLPVIVEGGTINGTQDSFVRVKAGEKSRSRLMHLLKTCNSITGKWKKAPARTLA